MRLTRMAAALALATAAPLGAQLAATADFGVAQLNRPGSFHSGAMTLGGDLRLTGSVAALNASGLFASTPGGTATGQSILGASAFAPADRRWRWELSALMSTFSSSGEPGARSAQFVAREYVGSPDAGWFGGAGFLALHQQYRVGGLLTHVGGWWRQQSNELAVLANATFIDIPGLSVTRHHDVDVIGAWQHTAGQYTLRASTGARFDSDAHAWGSAGADVWIASHFALVASAGHALPDIVRGVPATTYVTFGGRASLRERPPRVESARTPAITLTRIDDNRVRIDLMAGAAHAVELMADFTSWDVVSLQQTAGRWRFEGGIAPGLHRLAVRIDGGEWLPPANLPAIEMFGRRVGIITVP